MWKVFREEFKHLFAKRIKIIEYIIMLFIPFVYGFLYMNAYWAPFKHVDKLPIVILNKDKDDSGKKIVEKLASRELHIGNQIYTINVNPAPSIYTPDDAGEKKLEKAVNSGKYSAAIVIPETFSKSLEDFKNDSGIGDLQDALKGLQDKSIKKIEETISNNDGKFDIPKLIKEANLWTLWETKVTIDNFIAKIKRMDFVDLLDEFSKYFGKNDQGVENPNNIKFYNDYKNSYLAGEMTNFGAGLTDILLQIALSQSSITSSIYDSIKMFINDVADNSSIMEYKPIGQGIDTYGKGLSPYFMSIALFAGTLTMTFLIKNERHKTTKGISTIKHYFGKWLVWLLTGWAQCVILLTAITIQGVNIGMNQYQIFIWGFFVSAIFSTIVQAVVFSIRYGDIGEFAVVIILVIQLTSSSGTFPVEMQNMIFKIFHPIVPFTYSIDGFRELLYQPDTAEIIWNTGILILFPILLVPASITINYIFDKKHMSIVNGTPKFESFEINIGDL